jgi:hypothetical protein
MNCQDILILPPLDIAEWTLIELVSPFGLVLAVADWGTSDIPPESNDPIVVDYAGLTAEYEIYLPLLQTDTYFEGDTISFSGTASTTESSTQQVKVLVYAEGDCVGVVVSSSTVMIDTAADIYTFSGTFTAGTAGMYFMKAGLLDTGETTEFLYSACQAFTVEVDARPSGTLIIEKETVGYNGDWAFAFSGGAGNFVLGSATSSQTISVLAGELTITEAVQDNWQMTGVTCDYQPAVTETSSTSPLTFFSGTARAFAVNVPADTSVHCLVTNTYTPPPPPPQGELIVEKVVTGFTGNEWAFAFKGLEEDFTLTNARESERPLPWEQSTLVPAGTVTLTEEIISNWRMTNVSCEYENIASRTIADSNERVLAKPDFSFDTRNSTFVVEIPADTTVRCVVTNTYTPRSTSGSGTRTRNRMLLPLPSVPLTPTVSLSTTAPKCELLLTAYLRQGWNNDSDQVKKLQNFLNKQGFLVPVTGYFGSLTEAAVKAFQAAHNAEVLTPWGITEPTGFVFKTTRYKINTLHCLGSEAMPKL